MDLAGFLTMARRGIYVSTDRENLADGTTLDSFDHESWSYRDHRAGSSPFAGQEFICCDDRVVWVLNYYGTVLSDRPECEEIFNFQREVLAQPDPAHLMRGPLRYSRGAFAYRNDINGDLQGFAGQELIFHDGHEVCRMVFHGGRIESGEKS